MTVTETIPTRAAGPAAEPAVAIDGGIGVVVEAAGRTLSDLDPVWIAQMYDRHGAILFRGFPHDRAAFVAFSGALTDDFSNYQGGGLRFAALDREAIDGMDTLMTTTGHSQSFGLPLHGEMYYLAEPPRLLWFYADQAPAARGETTIADGAALYDALSPATQAWFAQNDILYRRSLVDGDWQATFMTESLDEAAAFCARNGLSMSHDAETGVVRTDYACSALRRTGDTTLFINNVLFIYLAEQAFRSGWAARNLAGLRSPDCPITVRAADGGALPQDVMADVRSASEHVTRKIAWRDGDIAMLDNHRILHGRADTDGGARSILVRMGTPTFGPAARQAAQ